MSDEWNRARTISASEIGDYVYCHRQWWLKRHHGVESVKIERMQQGSEFHYEHWQQVRTAVRNENLVYVLIGIALTIVTLALLIMFAYWLKEY